MIRFSKLNENKLFKVGINYSIASSCRSFASLFVGILIMRWLSPNELGLWNTVYIFQSYFPFLQLGIQSGLNRELPILLGAKKEIEARRLVASAKAYSFLIIVLFLIAALLFPIIFYFCGKSLEFVLGIFTICVMGASSSLSLHLIATYRSVKSFDKLTHIYIIDFILILLLTLFIYKFHYYGILIYNIIQLSVHSLLMYHWSPYKAEKAKFEFISIKKLIKTGIYLMSFIQIRAVASSIPKWMILKFATIQTLGLYTPANSIALTMNMLPSQIAQFLHPQMGFKYGETGKSAVMWPYMKKILIYFPLFSLPIAICVWIFSPWLLNTFFQKYIDSLWPMRIISVGFIFSSAYTTHGILYTIKAYKEAYIYSVTELIGYFLFPYIVVQLCNFSILTAITTGITINNIILYFLNIYLLKRTLFLPKYNEEN